MEITAKAKFVRLAPRKVRLVADLIRGLDVEEAMTQLKFKTKAAALPLAKLLKSAIYNGEENHKLKRSNLFIKSLTVDGGPTLHRWTPRAFGRATPIRKRSSHIILTLAEKVPTLTKAEKKKPEASQDDLIRIDDLEQLKPENKKVDGDKTSGKGGSALNKKGKGFTSKIFNRKSG